MTGFQTDAGGVAEEKLKIPLDLTEWCQKETLVAWIHEEIETLDWSNPQLVAYLQAHPTYYPKMWLRLLTFGYVTGTFESHEIVRLCYTDANFRSLCSDPIPSASELSKFRRENRGLLKWCLSQIFRRALREKFGLGEMLLPAGLKQFLAETATIRLDIARHVDRAANGA